jgi:capsid assembly protease
MIPFRHVAERFYNRPLWLAPKAAETISAFLLTRMSGVAAGGPGSGENDAGESRQFFAGTPNADGSLEIHSPRASRFYGDYPRGEDDRPLPFRRTPDGTAIITLVGEWVNRGAWVGASSGLISYEGFTYQMRRAGADPNTKGILLDIESPGGEAVGAFEAAAVVREVSQQKPVVALVNGLAASAAYAIASGAERIMTIPTGLVGSIGVVLMHLDISTWLEDEGVKPTLIFAGDHKVDGNPFEPLPKDVRKDMQAEVAGFYDQFVETVAVGRKMDAAKVIATQARLFKGEDAVAAGLADGVGTFESVLSDMSSRVGGRNQRGVSMTANPDVPAAARVGISQADHDKAVADAAAAAAANATKRIDAILTSKEAVGRGAMAHHLAMKTSMSAEDAIALLATAAKETPAATSRLDGKVPSPNVGTGETRSDAETIAAGWDAATAKVNAELRAAVGPGVVLKH